MEQPIAPSEIRTLADRVAAIVRDVVGADTHVWWFGSWVRGDAQERSDLDVALEAERALQPTTLQRIQEAIEQIPTLRRIDVIDLRAVSEDFRARILEEGQSL